jgi:hypothetical protein
MIIQMVHWIFYCYYLYLFGYAGLFKVFLKQDMVAGMERLGFNKTWTLAIGWGRIARGYRSLRRTVVSPNQKRSCSLPAAICYWCFNGAHGP